MEAALEQMIERLIIREGGDRETNSSADRGGRTKYGIAEKSNPDMWKDGPPSLEKAIARYAQKYLIGPKIHLIPYENLKEVMFDFAVTSGPQLAIQKLQQVLKLEQDGVIGPKTLAAVAAEDARWLVNKVSLERVKMAGRIVKRDPSQLTWLNGWLDRFSSFIE